MADETSGKITVEEAIRLKHDLNQGITYGGYNAKEISDMENLTKEQYSEINRQLSEMRKSWWFFPDYVWVIGIIVSGVCFFYFYQSFVRIAAVVVLAYCIGQLAYRSGVLYGYVRGYESGHEEGIHKALGVPTEEAAELGQRAIEMEMDENLIKKMDKRKGQQKGEL
jgi:hypothetical protein